MPARNAGLDGPRSPSVGLSWSDQRLPNRAVGYGMKKFSRLVWLWLTCAVVGASFTPDARSQDMSGPVTRIVVPFSPGGATDGVARLLAQALQALWKHPVIVEYRPGADTVIGVNYVAKSAPDGRTLALVNSAYVLNPALRRSMPYDTEKDLRGVTQIGTVQTALVARSDAPFSTVAEMIGYAREHPGKLNYGNSGVGSVSNIAMELMGVREGFTLLHVSFKGGSQVVTELISGRIDIATEPLVVVLPYVLAGRMKMLGTFGPKRVAGYEDRFRTVDESTPGLSAASLLGLVAPAATPSPVVEDIQRAVASVLARDDVRAGLRSMGVSVDDAGTSPSAFDALIRGETRRWAKVVAEAHIVVD